MSYVKKGLLEPRKHSRADLIKLKESLVLIQDITMEYGLSSLSEIFWASNLWYIAHSLPIAPFDPNTKGVKEPCSISSTVLLYTEYYTAITNAQVELLPEEL